MNKEKPRFNYTGNGWEGHNYNADLNTKDITKLVRQKLKEEFPKCKFSISMQRAGVIHISLMSAPFQAIISDVRWNYSTREIINEIPNKNGHCQLNEYRFNDEYCDILDSRNNGVNNGCRLTKEAWDTMARAYKILSSYNFDDSNGGIDYFHTNFYIHIHIGKWNKPFELKQ